MSLIRIRGHPTGLALIAPPPRGAVACQGTRSETQRHPKEEDPMATQQATQVEATLSGGRELAGKAGVVTGGARGIGRAIALELARHGASVAVGYSQNSEAADEV